MTKKKDPLKDEVLISEAYLVGLFWTDTDHYGYFKDTELNYKTFGNSVWGFYFELGRHMFEKGIRNFDDISVAKSAKEFNVESKYEKYGNYQTVEEIMVEVEDKADNFDGYYEDVKKYALLRSLKELFGDKVIKKQGKYDYHKMSRVALATYWSDKVNEIAIENDNPFKEFNLLEGLHEEIDNLDENPDKGLPLYGVKEWTDIFNGWAYGTITLLSAFSGNGKTSSNVRLLIMSCIKHKEKLLIMANETSIRQMRKLLLITIMGLHEVYSDSRYGKKIFQRQNIDKGEFTDEEKGKLHEAASWVEEQVKDALDLIKFVPLDTYTIDNVERVMRHYANRGYKRQILDTAKPTEDAGNSRWEKFVDQFDMLEKLVAEDTGLNVALWCTVQATDEYKKARWLDELCIADGRKIKNVVDTTYHIRTVFHDEREGGKHELEIYKYVADTRDTNELQKYGWTLDFNADTKNKKYSRWIKTLDRKHIYYLLFTSKNRRGLTNETGLDVLVLQVDLNTNRWTEIGWTQLDKNYAF